MANFGFSDLVLINPLCDAKELDAVKRAKHALPILKKAKVKDASYLKKFDTLVGTTSRVGTDFNIPRSPLSAEDLASVFLPLDKKKQHIGLLFGREGEGLHNDEIALCDFVVTIPSSVKYPALNLSHAVAVVLYELFKASSRKKVGESITPIGRAEKNRLLALISQVIDTAGFSTLEKKETQKKVWKRLIGKSFLSKREAFALFGFFRKMK